jgi:hypothetical protein
MNANTYIACLANDKKQSGDRLYNPIFVCFRLHRQFGGIFKDVNANLTQVILPNYTKIEAVPCDAPGEAGGQPMASFWSELWGFEHENKRRLWTEMTVPPTLYGRAFRWVESYAGFTGESELLENLYSTGFKNGIPVPEFEYLTGVDGPVVRMNEAAGVFCYWDTEPRMIWQTPEYYQQEANILDPVEMDRIHRNRWSSARGTFLQPEWWDACEDNALMPLKDGDSTPVVVGIDMAVSKDCAAIVAVTRDPFRPDTHAAIRAVRVFSPKDNGGTINQELTIGAVIKDWHKRWNVIAWVYDPREMAKMAQDYSRSNLGWFLPMGQQTPRAISDKELHDMVMHRQIRWSRNNTEGDVGYKGGPENTLYRHITQAGSDTSGGAYRLAKLATKVHIDAAVAASMAVHHCMKWELTNLEGSVSSLITKLARGEITQEEFSRLVRVNHPELEQARDR